MNAKTRAVVSLRLSISSREVAEALEKCEKAKKRK
jgi:hypothetical protein